MSLKRMRTMKSCNPCYNRNNKQYINNKGIKYGSCNPCYNGSDQQYSYEQRRTG